MISEVVNRQRERQVYIIFLLFTIFWYQIKRSLFFSLSNPGFFGSVKGRSVHKRSFIRMFRKVRYRGRPGRLAVFTAVRRLINMEWNSTI